MNWVNTRASLIFAFRGYLHYHLNGALAEHLSTGCVRFSLDEIRRWGMAHGYRWFNLPPTIFVPDEGARSTSI